MSQSSEPARLPGYRRSTTCCSWARLRYNPPVFRTSLVTRVHHLLLRGQGYAIIRHSPGPARFSGYRRSTTCCSWARLRYNPPFFRTSQVTRVHHLFLRGQGYAIIRHSPGPTRLPCYRRSTTCCSWARLSYNPPFSRTSQVIRLPQVHHLLLLGKIML
jgi:hypothetical protein